MTSAGTITGLVADRAEATPGARMVVDEKGNEKLVMSIRNLEHHHFLPPEGVNVYDILRHDHLIVSKAAAKALEARCLDGHSVDNG